MSTSVVQYVNLATMQEDVHAWFLELCSRLNLFGRVRVAKDGINVTVCQSSKK